jgi:integrase
MPSERLKWTVRRLNKDGTERWYWQKPKRKTVRLPDDPVKRLAVVRQLNGEGPDGKKLKRMPDTMAWCVQEYRESPEYNGLAASTLVRYDRWLQYFEAGELGMLDAADMTRKAVMRLRKKLLKKHGIGSVRLAFAVLRRVMEVARDNDLVEENPVSRPRLGSSGKRDQRWSVADIAAFRAKAPAHLAFALDTLLYTGQRSCDVIRIALPAIDLSAMGGRGVITVRQQKGRGKLVRVPVHRDYRPKLEAAMAQAKAGNRLVIVATENGGSWSSAESFGFMMRTWIRKLKLADLQTRDLRRTAYTLLLEAGATTEEAAALVGHSKSTAAEMGDVYGPATAQMAENAVAKWERNKR